MKTEDCAIDAVPVETSPSYLLGIDVLTKEGQKLRSRLVRLVSTLSVADGGAYREDPAYSQIHITTTLTEDELDEWLWCNCANVGYVGVFQR